MSPPLETGGTFETASIKKVWQTCFDVTSEVESQKTAQLLPGFPALGTQPPCCEEAQAT